MHALSSTLILVLAAVAGLSPRRSPRPSGSSTEVPCCARPPPSTSPSRGSRQPPSAGSVVLALGALEDVLELQGSPHASARPRRTRSDARLQTTTTCICSTWASRFSTASGMGPCRRSSPGWTWSGSRRTAAPNAAARRRTGPGSRAPGWSQAVWGASALPEHGPLSRACPDNPVLLARVDGHAGWANRAALRFAPAAGAEPRGHESHAARTERASGALLERANEPLFGVARMPPLGDADVIAAFRKAVASLAARGVTEADDAGFLSPPGLVDLEASLARYLDLLTRADAETPLPVRVGLMIPAPSALAARVLSGPRELSPRLHVTHLKLFADGALGSRGAALSHPLRRRPKDARSAAHGPGVAERLGAARPGWRARRGHPCDRRRGGRQRARRLRGVARRTACSRSAPLARGTLLYTLTPPTPTSRAPHVSACCWWCNRASTCGAIVERVTPWSKREWARQGAARVYAFGRLVRAGARLAGSTDEFGAAGVDLPPRPRRRHASESPTGRRRAAGSRRIA